MKVFKRCPACKHTLEAKRFSIDTSCMDGLSRQCRECQRRGARRCRFAFGTDRLVGDPTEAEIAALRDEISAGWSEREREKRAGAAWILDGVQRRLKR